MGVKRSAYRQPLTPLGLKSIEEGTLTWLDDDMYNNLNTGLLEQYLEEKNLEDSYQISHWSTAKVGIGVLMGLLRTLDLRLVWQFLQLGTLHICLAWH